MLVVKVELHSAITQKITEIGRMVIWNDGTAESAKRGNYDARVLRKPRQDSPYERLPMTRAPYTREGRVEDYPRLPYPIWRLVSRALRSCYPEEK